MNQMSSSVSAQDEQLLATLTAHLKTWYDMSVLGLDRVGGEVDRNYHVAGSTGQAFLAKIQMGKLPEMYQWQDAILGHLEGRDVGVSVPTIVRASDGSLRSHLRLGDVSATVSVHHWLPGTDLINVDNHSDSLIREVGTASAKITRALEGFDAPELHESHHWDVTRSNEAIGSCLNEMPQLAEEPYVGPALEWFEQVRADLVQLPRALAHQDLNDNNILVETVAGRQRVSAVLDFNDALFTVRVADLAIAGAYAMLRKEDPLRALGLVVSGYQSVQPLSSAELGAVYPLAVARLCVQLLTWSTRAHSNPTEYGRRRMRHTRATLDQLTEIEPAKAAEYLFGLSPTPLRPPGNQA